MSRSAVVLASLAALSSAALAQSTAPPTVPRPVPPVEGATKTPGTLPTPGGSAATGTGAGMQDEAMPKGTLTPPAPQADGVKGDAQRK